MAHRAKGTALIVGAAALFGASLVFTSVHTSVASAQPAEKQADAGAGSPALPIPIEDLDKLHAYLKSGAYKGLPVKEEMVHPSRGPHAKFGWPVRVFAAQELFDSLKAGNKEHPKGSSLVKELYDKQTKQLLGWAVMVKTQDMSDRGKGWFWYEVLSTDDARKFPVDPGNGVKLCVGCHINGSKDFVLTHLKSLK